LEAMAEEVERGAAEVAAAKRRSAKVEKAARVLRTRSKFHLSVRWFKT